MSLQLAAKHLAAQGRGPDKQLVHMSPREVAGLQALAMAHGGSLSINPKTGLPEAGFLDKLLPMLVGVGITAATGGAAAPWMVGLGIGGFEAARTGNLSKGLMAGLGAYGGAGLAGGLMGAGAAGAAQAAAPGAEVLDAALAGSGGAGGAGMAGITGGAPLPVSELSPRVLDAAMANQSAMAAAQAGPGFSAVQPGLDVLGAPMAPTQAFVPGIGEAPPALAQMITSPTIPTTTPAPDTSAFSTNMSKMGKGLEGLTTPEGRGAFMKSVDGGKGLLKYGAAAGLPLLISQPKPMNVPTGGPNPYNYAFDPGRVEDPEAGYTGALSGERRFFNPTYRRLAGGGPVEEMSNANAIGANTGYPMADIQRNAYAVPYQQPMSQSVVTGPQDTAVDPFTGAERMAGGGITGSGELNLNIPLNFGGGFGGGFNQGPLDLGQNKTGFGQGVANGYQPVGSGASSSPPGFLSPKPNNTVGLTENPFSLGTQLASRLGSANQNPFAAQPTPEMMAAQREANSFSSAGNLADLQRRVGDREQSFDEFQDRRIRNSVREPGDRMPTAAELQSGYKDYVQDRNNNLAKISGLQSAAQYQAQQKEMMDRIRGMQQQIPQMAVGGLAGGGISHLGDYSDGGRLLKGPGDGVSDSIPAVIGNKQPARLADGEFVVPARIVSELGNGSTDAGARKLYAMMDRIQNARSKTTGKNKVAANTRAEKYMPA